MSQEKLQTIVTQTFWGVIEVYYGIVQVVKILSGSASRGPGIEMCLCVPGIYNILSCRYKQ